MTRSCHSLSEILCQYKNINIVFVQNIDIMYEFFIQMCKFTLINKKMMHKNTHAHTYTRRSPVWPLSHVAQYLFQVGTPAVNNFTHLLS